MNLHKLKLAKYAKSFSSNDWVFEIKWDGFRAIAYANDWFSLKRRNGLEFKNKFPEIS